MKFLYFIIVLFITVGLIFMLDNSQTVNGTSLPAFGKLFSPKNGFWQQAKAGVSPQSNAELSIPGLSAPVEVVFDERMVPHIFALNTADAYRVQGYLTAKERLWQMDISSRAAGGRLAEIIGEPALDMDLSMHRHGIPLAAANAASAWSQNEEAMKLIYAYCEGVNTYVRQLRPADYPIEYKLIGYEPEEWTPIKCALMVKGMALTLNRKEKDIAHSNALDQWGPELFRLLYPASFPKSEPIVSYSDSFRAEVPAETDALGHFPIPFQQTFEDGIGSNNWAVSGKKTASGYPILANDPHLELTLPSIWYEVQLHTAAYNAYGVSLPGLPGIIIGFNEHIAWGETNVGHDVADWYAVQWADSARTQYLLDDKVVNVKQTVSTIRVKDQADVQDTILYTAWGPVVNDPQYPDVDNLAFRWVSNQDPISSEILFIEKLNQAKNYDDFQQALTHYHSPAQNFVFACEDGDIAIRVQGKLPIKQPGQGWTVQDGSKSKDTWKGYVPHNELPVSHNPDRGFVASANQISTDASYPYPYIGFFDEYRSRRLNRQLRNMDAITIKDMMALQQDDYSIFPEEALPILLERLDKDELSQSQRAMVSELEAWDFHFHADGVAPALFENWFDQVRSLTWDEMESQGPSRPMPIPEDWVLVHLMDSLPDFSFFDRIETDAITENATDIVSLAFHYMADSLQSTFDEGDLHWADYRARGISHLGRIDAFEYKNLRVGGYAQALNAVKTKAAPSWRMIVQTGPNAVRKAYGIYPGGQSGNPGSPFYEDMVNDWAEGRYHELILMDDPSDDKVEVLQRMIIR